jgi:hypothetical protein
MMVLYPVSKNKYHQNSFFSVDKSATISGIKHHKLPYMTASSEVKNHNINQQIVR